jgi:hypothetical protein
VKGLQNARPILNHTKASAKSVYGDARSLCKSARPSTSVACRRSVVWRKGVSFQHFCGLARQRRQPGLATPFALRPTVRAVFLASPFRGNHPRGRWRWADDSVGKVHGRVSNFKVDQLAAQHEGRTATGIATRLRLGAPNLSQVKTQAVDLKQSPRQHSRFGEVHRDPYGVVPLCDCFSANSGIPNVPATSDLSESGRTPTQ